VIGVGATLNERFTLDRELGQGGMGTVYRATDQLLGRTVAIKFLKDSRTEEEARRIRLEAQILARLVHDRIVRLYDFGASEGVYFLVMEEVNGPSFSNRWRDLILADRLRICGQVAEALHYAHIQGVIHRDVKPSNVLLTPGDEAKLSDFGLSVIKGDGTDEGWSIRGTPTYMSPEQAQGIRLDHRTDLYSVGVMLYECVTGAVPFDGDARSVMRQHANAVPPPPRFRNPEIWSTLEKLILSLLAKNPAKRPASGNVVALELYEEAERASRLRRINPGVRRSGAPGLVEPPPSRTVTVGGASAELTPANGERYAGLGSSAQRAAEPPSSSDVPQVSATTGSWLSSLKDPLESFLGGRRADLRADSHPVARQMLAETLAAPIVLSPEQRYLSGHYLAFLLGGARRRGILLRRPLDAGNADRARLLLAMAWLSCVGPTDEAIERASTLLDDRPDVRAALSPVVVVKYLASRDTPAKHRWFRQVRRRLKERSAYARKAMLDSKGVLNPGVMPRTLDDLRLIAPPDMLDAHRVSLWNRVAEVWRQEHDFRKALLRYATPSNRGDTVSVDLWPEVVYPLIEQAHWQRTFRPPHEAIWDYVVGKLLHVPVAGVRLDRMMIIAIPLEVAEQLDLDLSRFVDEPQFAEEETSSLEMQVTETQTRRPIYFGGVIPREEAPADDDAPPVKVMVPLAQAEPFVFTQDTLRKLWEEAVDAQDNGMPLHAPHRTIPVGPYELAVIPTGGGRSSLRPGSAVRAVLQGMQQRGKQIEIFTPSALARESGSRTVIAIWIYQDASMVIAYVDFQHRERYILWHAPGAYQLNYDYLEELRARLSVMNLEVPDQIDQIVSGK
jgi:serine/threonine-protein kinase